MSAGRFSISAGAMVMAALLYYLDDNGIFLWLMLACLFHEMGHWAAIHALGGRVSRLRITCAGAELCLSGAHMLSPGKMAAAALAGPAVNLLLALISAWGGRQGAGEGLYFFAGLNLGLACFNLLPAGWLDGGRVLKGVLEALGKETLGRGVTLICSDVAAAVLLGGGVALLWQSDGKNFTLLIAGLWMMRAAREEGRNGLFS